MLDQKDKPVFDEQTLARVLEAAYVLQEHNRAMELSLELQSDQLREQHAESESPPALSHVGSDDNSGPKDDYTAVLAQIVETQHQIQLRQLDLKSTMALVAERLTQITLAIGAAVGIVEGKTVCYEATSGTSALPCGSKLPMEKALCFTCLRTGQVMRCADVHPEFLLDAEECDLRGIQSLIAVPVYHDGGVAGALELHFGKADGFNDQDVHTCQLMASLVTEALTRDAQLTWKRSLAIERATMLEAIEKLRPNLAALAQAPVAKESAPKDAAPATAEHAHVCWKCGHAIVGEEQFCGRCGAPRIVDHEPSSLQSKVASLWQMKEGRNAPRNPANGAAGATEPQEQLKAGEQDFREADLQEPDLKQEDLSERELARLLANSVPDFSVTHDPVDLERSVTHPRTGGTGNARPAAEKLAQTERIPEEIEESVLPGVIGTETKGAEASATDAALVKTDQDITWTSAAKARDFLEQVAQSHPRGPFQLFWNQRRGDIYLAIAVILMAIVIRWGIWSDHAVGATSSGVTNASHRRDADLSMFDRLLINLGLAEAPDQPEPKGNPDTQVWVDLHTALYYCPGTDLYGKTPKGRYTSQKDAQLDQFEPAYRKACD